MTDAGDPLVEALAVGKLFDPAVSPFGTSTTLLRVLRRRRAVAVTGPVDVDEEDDDEDDDEDLEDDDAERRDTAVWAVHDLSFAAAGGRGLGFVGPPGSGKSTVLRLVAGVTPPTSGRIVVRGRVGPLASVATLFMRAEASARDNAATAGMVSGISGRSARAAARGACDLAGLDPRDPAPGVDGLRLLAAAVSVVVPSDVVVMDGLPVAEPAVLEAFADALRGRMAGGAAVLLSGREREALAELCDDVVVLAPDAPVLAAPTGTRGARAVAFQSRKRHLKWGRTRVWTSPFNRFAAILSATAVADGADLVAEVEFESVVPNLGVHGQVEIVVGDAQHVVVQADQLQCAEPGRHRLVGRVPAALLPSGAATVHIALEVEYAGHVAPIEREDCFSGELAGARAEPGQVVGGTWELSPAQPS